MWNTHRKSPPPDLVGKLEQSIHKQSDTASKFDSSHQKMQLSVNKLYVLELKACPLCEGDQLREPRGNTVAVGCVAPAAATTN